MVKKVRRSLVLALAMAMAGSGLSCGGAPAAQPKTVTYKCLISSCDAVVVCHEGDPVPEHHGKPMIR